MRPQRLRIATCCHIAGNKKVAQDVSGRSVLRLSNSLEVSRLERVMAFYLGPVFYAHATGTSASAEASVAYAARILVL